LLLQPARRGIPGVAKPLKCRARLHNWETVKPETHEHYKFHLRCNAHIDRGNAAIGAERLESPSAGIG
jgi:hypothetical protein